MVVAIRGSSDPEMTVQIFSGVEPGKIVRMLTGKILGTMITVR